MTVRNREAVQILNTAIIKRREKNISSSYEIRLSELCESPVIQSISLAITHLAGQKNISHDQAAMEIIDTVEELNSIWSDYISMEGIGNLKKLLKQSCASKHDRNPRVNN